MIKITSQHHYCLLEPLGPLTSEDFNAIAQHIDPIIEGGGRLDGLMIKTRSFPGWESLGDVIEPIRFVKNHHRAIDRIALVTDTPLAHIFPAIVGHFVSAQVRHKISTIMTRRLSGCSQLTRRTSAGLLPLFFERVRCDTKTN